MLDQEIQQAAEEFERPASGLILSGLSAGLGVGFSFFLIAVVTSMSSEQTSQLMVEVLTANAFAVGFIIAILGRMDLFTEFTTIAILPVFAKQATLGALARLWAAVYLGNLLGASILGGLTVVVGIQTDVISRTAIASLAGAVVGHSWWLILISGALTGWMMGVLSWLITGGRDTTSQILFIWLITASIGLMHLPHTITATAELCAAVLVDACSWRELFHFLVWATLGNAIGGILFAASVVYSLHMRHKEAPESVKPSADR